MCLSICTNHKSHISMNYNYCLLYACNYVHTYYILQDSPVEGYTKYDDGWHGGKRLFMSQINRGLFLPMKGLFPDERFLCDHTKDLPNRKLGALNKAMLCMYPDLTRFN